LRATRGSAADLAAIDLRAGLTRVPRLRRGRAERRGASAPGPRPRRQELPHAAQPRPAHRRRQRPRRVPVHVPLPGGVQDPDPGAGRRLEPDPHRPAHHRRRDRSGEAGDARRRRRTRLARVAAQTRTHRSRLPLVRVRVRAGEPSDVPAVHRLMRQLAEHEDMLQYFALNEDALHRSCFDEPRRMAFLVAEEEGAIVGFASYIVQFSPWAVQDYLYLDDLYVSEAARGHGAGTMLMRELGAIALERGLGVRWHVEKAAASQPAQKFYRALGAELRDRFSVYWSLDAIRAELERL